MSNEENNEFGSLKIPKTIKRGNEYVSQIASIYELRTETRIIKNGDLQKGEGRLTRDHSLLVNNIDHKVLAESIQYGRAGGDRCPPGMHSIEDCPNEPIDLFDKVFFKLKITK